MVELTVRKAQLTITAYVGDNNLAYVIVTDNGKTVHLEEAQISQVNKVLATARNVALNDDKG